MPGRSIARRFAISVGVVCLVLALGIGTFFFAAQAPSMDPIVPPPANSFASDLVQRGATLAAIGNCDVCHTAPGGREFAGGRALARDRNAAEWRGTAGLSQGPAGTGHCGARRASSACGRGEVAVGDLYAALYRAWLDRSLMRCRVVRRRCHDDLESHAGR